MSDPATIQDLNSVIETIIGLLLGLGGIALFVMLLVGGFKYLTSGGDPKSVESAKKTLTSAIAGLILTASAYLILRLIAYIAGSPRILNFNVYLPF